MCFAVTGSGYYAAMLVAKEFVPSMSSYGISSHYAFYILSYTVLYVLSQYLLTVHSYDGMTQVEALTRPTVAVFAAASVLYGLLFIMCIGTDCQSRTLIDVQ